MNSLSKLFILFCAVHQSRRAAKSPLSTKLGCWIGFSSSKLLPACAHHWSFQCLLASLTGFESWLHSFSLRGPQGIKLCLKKKMESIVVILIVVGFCFELMSSLSVNKASLKLSISLPQPHKCLDYKCELLLFSNKTIHFKS